MAPLQKERFKIETFGRLDDRTSIDDSALITNISKRFKSETNSIFTKTFVDDAILIFRESKRKKKGMRRKVSLSIGSNQPLSSN